jgi:hypothetical protein
MPRHLRCALAATIFLAALIPYAAFLTSGFSPFETFWEFSCYRYFEALSYFEQPAAPFWVVQGMPMALLQVLVMAPFVAFDMPHLGTPEQIERFSHASLLLAYLLIALALAVTMLRRRVLPIDALAIAVVLLALFPMARWYPYFFAPDYWIFEVPFAIVSAAWATTALRLTYSKSPLPSLPAVAVAGVWIALCVTQKPSLAGLGAFPILFQLSMPRGNYFAKTLRLLLLAVVFLVAHDLILLALNKFDFTLAELARLNYWRWIGGTSSSGTSLLSLGDLLVSSGYLTVPIFVGTLALIAGTAAAFLDGERRKAVAAGAILGFVLLGHCLVIRIRPSGTSVIDMAIYGTFLIPISLAIGRIDYRRYGVTAAAVLIAILVPRPLLVPPQQPSLNMTARINEASAYVRSLSRPVRVVVHDNRAHPLAIEALALYTGQLPPVRGTSPSLRDRFIPDAKMISQRSDLQDAIAHGDVIIWGSAPGAPSVETDYPDIASFQSDSRAVIRTIEIVPGSHTAHIGYLPGALPQP